MRRYWVQSLWLLFMPMYLWAGTRPDGYAEAVLGATPSYPLHGILVAITVTTVESLVLYWIMRPDTDHRSWRRACAALLVYFPWLLVCLVMLMHAPPYVFVHALWLLCVNLILLGLLASTLIQRMKRQRVRRSQED